MQTIMDAASHIAEEIERTRLHLANLEQALAGLQPLLTIDVSITTLPFSQVGEAQAVEDARIVNVAKPRSKTAKAATVPKHPKAKAKASVSPASKPKAVSAAVKSPSIPATGAAFWMQCVGRKAFSSAELAQAALTKLSLGAASKNAIANRARAWITGALKQGSLVPAGTRSGIHLYKRA